MHVKQISYEPELSRKTFQTGLMSDTIQMLHSARYLREKKVFYNQSSNNASFCVQLS